MSMCIVAPGISSHACPRGGTGGLQADGHTPSMASEVDYAYDKST
jgi:hypothetical protein